MSIARSVADVLRDHVVLEIEGIDRMHLNVYVPTLQTVGAVVGYLRVHRGQRFASTAAVAPMTEAFVRTIEEFVDREGIDLVTFGKRQRKDDVTQQRLRRFEGTEGVLYVGKAQEKARVMRTERRRSARTGGTYPWIVESTAMVNHYYFYCVDEDFGPFFLKFCSYFPYNAKLNINGHEYLKRQLAKRGVPFEAIDNGLKSCADPKLAQRLCDGLSAAKIDQLLRKWLRRLPHPFPPRDRAAGYRYQLSILQAEFALTQVLDQPVTGRIFFEEVIRETSFQDMQRPVTVDNQRAAALRFADPRVQALLHVLLLFLLVHGTFTHKDVREHLAPLLGHKPSQYTPGRITYDLRRLRLHALIERIPRTHRYRITAKGLRAAVLYTRLYSRALRPGLAIISPACANPQLPMAKSIRAAEAALDKWCQHAKIAA